MKTCRCLAWFLLLTTVSVGFAVASEAPAPAPGPVSPLMTELLAAQSASQAAVAELSRSLAETTDQAGILAIQHEIARLKDAARLETFRIQLRYARAEGRIEAVDQLERLLEQLTTPRAAGTPTRPAPADAGSR